MKKLLFLCIIVNFSHAKIQQLATMKDLLKSISYDKNTYFIFDIDNTVAEPHQSLGSDQWFFDQLAKQPIEQLVENYIIIQNSIDMYPVEKMTPKLIRKLQKKGYVVMALTARSIELVDRTIEQLKKMGIDFDRNPPSKKDFSLSLTVPAYYKKGILFSGRNEKGKLLLHFFDIIGHRPDKVIFVDDKEYNVVSVNNGLLEYGITCECFRYSYLDAKVEKFHEQQRHIETPSTSIGL